MPLPFDVRRPRAEDELVRRPEDEPGRVVVPLVEGESDGDGWKLGGPLGALLRLITGRKD